MANLDGPRVEDISPLSGLSSRTVVVGQLVALPTLRPSHPCRGDCFTMASECRKVGSPMTARGFPAGKRQTLARDLTNEVTIGL